jgi:hypothetical protein
MTAEQILLVGVPDYSLAFTWLIISILSGSASLVLQFVLRCTPEDLWQRLEQVIIPSKYREYASQKRPPILIAFCVIAVIVILSEILTSIQIDRMFDFTKLLWNDAYYRVGVEAIFLSAVLTFILRASVTVWTCASYPVTHNYYSNAKLKRKNDEISTQLLHKYLIRPSSFAAYLAFGTWTFLVLQAKIASLLIVLLIAVTPFFVFVCYLVVKVEFEMQRNKAPPHFGAWDMDFKYYRSVFGSGLVISIFVVIVLQPIFLALSPISHFILDGSLLSSGSIKGLLTSANVLKTIGELSSSLAYLIPLSFLIAYYTICAFALAPAYLPRKNRNRSYVRNAHMIGRDVSADLLIFSVGVIATWWLQSQLEPVSYSQLPLSFVTSFVIVSFKNYLKGLTHRPTS